MDKGIAVSVGVRVRPLLANEESDVIKYVHEDPPVLCVSDKRNVYAFDHIFSSDVRQYEIYNVMLKPLVCRVLSGYNCTILAYGQTGTGKTYTMGSDSQKYHNDPGLIPRVVDEFIELSTIDSDISISISFIEIYNEKVYDLLRPSKTALAVKGFTVHGMTCVPIESSAEACHWLMLGGRGRHVRHTAQNASSSRSHAVFTVYCTKNTSGITSKLHLVDLAGSESVRRTGNQGRAFQEGVTINRGLLAVGRVISALSDKRGSVVPYRDSTLTTILHDSLSTDNYVSLLACVSSSETDVSETLATLRFAMMAKSLKSKPQLETIIAEYDRAHPGVLNVNAPITTVKKRRRPALFTSTLMKRSCFSGNRNLPNPLLSDSPNYASTMDSLSVSTSTVINVAQPQFQLSPLVRRCTEALQDSVREQVNMVLGNHPVSLSEDKENTGAEVVSWDSLERRVTQIIRNELAQLTVPRRNIDETIKITSPPIKRQLKFNSLSPLNNSNSSPLILKPEDTFKIPVGRAMKAPKRTSIAIGTSPMKPVPLRRSIRLSMKLPEVSMPTPAPRYNMTISDDDLPESNEITLASSTFKPNRRSVRLSMKCLTPQTFINTPAPAPRLKTTNQYSESMPTPAPRRAIMTKPKGPSKVNTQKLISARTPHKKHSEQVLRILNRGTQKDLQQLATVGVKTAIQIITYRTLNGEFKSFSDLKRMPAWIGNGFDRFMIANQLRS
ncbi:no distributive disjunction [Carabus blaptoides fortunei]